MSDLKEELETLRIRKKEVTISKLDIVAIYPSIQFLIVKKAVEHFSTDLPREEEKKIRRCLKLIQFGMSNTLITFVNKYYEYGGDTEGNKQGLTIGGFEPVWLADLIAAYILQKTQEIFNEMKYHRIYRDDGFIIFEGCIFKEDINKGLLTSQKNVDKLAESDCLQFTAEIWGIEEDLKIRNGNITIVSDEMFPYLDMEMYWNERGELKFQVHLKPTKKLKYLNADSTHLPSIFRAIPVGVINRLSKLTSMTKAHQITIIDEAYPHHSKVLQIAGISPEKFPTFQEIETLRTTITKEEISERKREKDRRRKKQTFFCIGASQSSLRSNKHPPPPCMRQSKI